MAQDFQMDVDESRVGEWSIASPGERRQSSRIRAASSTPSEATANSIPQKRSNPNDVDAKSPQQLKRTLRQRSNKQNGTAADPAEEAMKPLTNEERRSWKGWVELESDPAIFDFILREDGVDGVKVQELINLEDETMDFLPQPIYGLIFLFRYQDEDCDDTEAEELSKCPKHVWFANQTISNACATVALLNIIMNVPEINLGEVLSSFKQDTQGLKPAYRGQRLSQNDSIRFTHNSFARRMDILNANLGLQNDFEKWEKNRNPKRIKPSNNRKKKADEEESGFHFIAYVPINGVVWRLDGLQQQPVNLGEAGDSWLAVARASMMERFQKVGKPEFNLLALCKSPMQSIRDHVAENLNLVLSVQSILDELSPDWKVSVKGEKPPQLDELFESIGISQTLISNSKPPAYVLGRIDRVREDPSSLLKLYEELLRDLAALRSSFFEEVTSIGREDEQVARRKQDHSPVIYNSIKALAEAGVLKGIVQDIKKTHNTTK